MGPLSAVGTVTPLPVYLHRALIPSEGGSVSSRHRTLSRPEQGARVAPGSQQRGCAGHRPSFLPDAAALIVDTLLGGSARGPSPAPLASPMKWPELLPVQWAQPAGPGSALGSAWGGRLAPGPAWALTAPRRFSRSSSPLGDRRSWSASSVWTEPRPAPCVHPLTGPSWTPAGRKVRQAGLRVRQLGWGVAGSWGQGQ